MAKNPLTDEAFALYKQGLKLIDIAKQLDLPEGTVRRWKCSYHWDGERSGKKKANVRNKGGAPKGNKNAVGHGAPKGNDNAKKYGFLQRYLPEDTWDIFQATGEMDPPDMLWHQIQIAYAAILRAQRISYVKDHDDKTTNKIGEKNGDTVFEERWEVQEAWDKQEGFLKAQARAQSELRGLIKQYEEMIDRRSGMASEEQKARIALLKAKANPNGGAGDEPVDDGFLEALNSSAKEDWKDEASSVLLPAVQPEAEENS